MCWVGFHRLASQGLTHSPIYRHGPAKAMKSDEKLLKNQWLLDYKTIEQARKSSEDTHFTEYARFEKIWAG